MPVGCENSPSEPENVDFKVLRKLSDQRQRPREENSCSFIPNDSDRFMDSPLRHKELILVTKLLK